MRCDNFILESPGGVVLLALGHAWDLHNCVDFRGLRYEPLLGEVVLEWSPLPEYRSNPWGDVTNKATGCRLRFREVQSVRIGPREGSYPAEDATCVESFELGVEEQTLVLNMQDTRVIEIQAGRAAMERDL